ncbi:putative bifunctional diguanylate cyclase/phosphodiesterase [Xanthomonas campestris]|uniref:putative bifunctional diguanylate cyclase/phosphodiesterase n=1 Tax=Xanthomonas campestris TaxID=339 RepID=UPI000E327C93|nr:bifunctional diguanylate cyclase/phosphodiesterase [Xanthomonas campestris]MEA9735089.1 EAL domain-containing protein [Xanthomonas campestris pv. raphani]MEA9738542.1 EAL domain-containing protein [Xanthomonas campestris pv. raphani]MEA9759640.1 EAL domain-containing protein [Xanthomonas campestris pv. raphani]MEA9794407.1 EAL domain-containing protein [Xanthomonas campestris pv. raphani]MEA9842439.1 EAL domain-containing protein [Xanthomonas campestris pv. raphani]
MKAMRLHTRIAALLVLVVLGTQALTFIAVQVATERSVKAQLGEELLIGERVWQRINQRRDEQLLQSASVLADDFGFRAAVASGDVPTMQSALRNHAARMDAQTAVLLSPEGDFLTGLADLPQAEQLRAVQALLQQAQHDGRAVGVVALDQHVVRLAVVQVLAPSRVGWIAIGNESGDSLAQDFRSTTGLDATFFIDGAPPRVLASTLEPAERMEFAQQLRTAEHAQGAAIPLTLGDSRYLVKLQSIQGDTRVRVALQASLDRAVAPYRTLKLRILLLAGLATAAALGVSIFLARSVSKPVALLVQAARRIQRGDYHTTVQLPPGRELAELADSFGRMQQQIATREQHILHQARHDALTGLPNRIWLLEQLQQVVDQTVASGGTAAVLILDLERFKELNDSLGHDFADQVLVEAGRRLAEVVQAPNIVGRLGSDEFMVVVAHADPATVQEEAQRLLLQLRSPLALPQARIQLEASIGIALIPEHGADPDTLLRRADIARGQVGDTASGASVYRLGQDEQHLRRLRLTGDLRQAIGGNELTLRFQPKISLRTDQVEQVEVLVRWHHPVLGPIGPDEFIPLAEHSGVIHPLTRFVLDEALHCQSQWRAQGLELGMAINLSALDLSDPGLPDFVRGCLQRHAVPASSVTLELTESALMRDVEFALHMLHQLRNVGVRLSVDDFGTGYSSLAQLKRMPVNELKIDKSFVMQLAEGTDDAFIVRSTIDLGHNLGLSVIAEGVENDTALALLRGYGCDMVQGYLYSPPLEEKPLLAWCMRQLGRSPAAQAGGQR